MIYLSVNHIIRDLTSFRLAAYDMEPCCDFNGRLAGLRPGRIGLGLFVLDSLDSTEERCTWILGAADTTFLKDDRTAMGL